MDKANEVIEVSEQEIPFHLLPQEEQQRIIAANRKMVREASTLHEWNIRVPTVFAWPMILMMIVFMTLFFGVGGVLLAGDNDWNGVYIVFGVCTAMAPYFRYLVMADKNYHYRLTTEGIIATYQDTISEVAYTIVRGLAWLGVMVCVIAVAILGPLALVGAGAMALFSAFCTGFKHEVCEEFTLFNKKWPHILIISTRYRSLRFESVPFKSAFSRTLFCRVEDMDQITTLIKSQIFVEDVKPIKGHPGI